MRSQYDQFDAADLDPAAHQAAAEDGLSRAEMMARLFPAGLGGPSPAVPGAGVPSPSPRAATAPFQPAPRLAAGAADGKSPGALRMSQGACLAASRNPVPGIRMICTLLASEVEPRGSHQRKFDSVLPYRLLLLIPRALHATDCCRPVFPFTSWSVLDFYACCRVFQMVSLTCVSEHVVLLESRQSIASPPPAGLSMGGSPHDSPAKQLAAMLRSTLRSPSSDGAAQPTVGIPETLAGGASAAWARVIFRVWGYGLVKVRLSLSTQPCIAAQRGARQTHLTGCSASRGLRHVSSSSAGEDQGCQLNEKRARHIGPRHHQVVTTSGNATSRSPIIQKYEQALGRHVTGATS